MRVRWLRRALLDLDAVEEYIARDDPQAAAGVVLRIVRAVSLLKEQPGIGRAGRVSGTKEMVVPNTPFIVPYRVKDDAIQILRVYHSSRKWPDQFR
ncbi:MAG TPA: type II toxin-antitoxin system RelE/ParE family toxin [Dongiaceae bacterium]|nr:type II toxin-antitoxin system RelE/ParE family toxin [Dongiaceae bacterium]